MLLLAFLSCVRRQVLTTSVRQAMMFFIVGLAIGFVLPLGRDVLNCLGPVGYNSAQMLVDEHHFNTLSFRSREMCESV